MQIPCYWKKNEAGTDKQMWAGVLGVLSLINVSIGALAGETKNQDPLWSNRDCPVACVVVYNPGGNIAGFRRAALQLKLEGRKLVIDGDCISACTMAADAARPNVCITQRAKFRFHRGYAYKVGDDGKPEFQERFDPWDSYSVDLLNWVQKNGGFPGKTKDDDTLLDMSFEEAKPFFHVCEGL